MSNLRVSFDTERSLSFNSKPSPSSPLCLVAALLVRHCCIPAVPGVSPPSLLAARRPLKIVAGSQHARR
ncbi:putative endothelin-converting enzyme 1-like [Sesbania bispinosa]|nr:putative endothelin-converting enzyme 1-like [Sesbania bispinosa]